MYIWRCWTYLSRFYQADPVSVTLQQIAPPPKTILNSLKTGDTYLRHYWVENWKTTNTIEAQKNNLNLMASKRLNWYCLAHNINFHLELKHMHFNSSNITEAIFRKSEEKNLTPSLFTGRYARQTSLLISVTGLTLIQKGRRSNKGS